MWSSEPDRIVRQSACSPPQNTRCRRYSHSRLYECSHQCRHKRYQHISAHTQHAQPLSSHNTPTLFISKCSHPLSPDGFRLASDIIYLQHQFLAASASAINKKPVASEDVCPPPTRLLIVLVCQFSEAAHAKVVFTNQQRTFQGLAIVISTLLPSTPL